MKTQRLAANREWPRRCRECDLSAALQPERSQQHSGADDTERRQDDEASEQASHKLHKLLCTIKHIPALVKGAAAISRMLFWDLRLAREAITRLRFQQVSHANAYGMFAAVIDVSYC